MCINYNEYYYYLHISCSNGFNDSGSVSFLYNIFGNLYDTNVLSPPAYMKLLSIVLIDLLYVGSYNKMSTQLQVKAGFYNYYGCVYAMVVG